MAYSKKGTDSIIAVVLIVMITVASAGSFFFWYNRVQQTAQGRAEYSTTVFLNQLVSCAKIPYANYNLLSNESEVQIQNCGTTSITIGDGDDNVLVTSEPCAFAISADNCDVCPMRIGPGALATLKVRFNDITCSGTTTSPAAVMADQGNLEHKITFSLDKTTTSASKTFMPKQILSCTITLNESIDFNIGAFPNLCINYTATTDNTVAQTYTISATTTDAVNCHITSINDGIGCFNGSVISQKTFAAKETGYFSILVDANPNMPEGCYISTKLTSTDMSTCTDSDTVWLYQ